MYVAFDTSREESFGLFAFHVISFIVVGFSNFVSKFSFLDTSSANSYLEILDAPDICKIPKICFSDISISILLRFGT